MALIHAATIAPTKAEAIAAWLPHQVWAGGVATGATIEPLGAYRFDDPQGDVGLEGHLVRCGQRTFHVPLTYRAAPLLGAEQWLVTTMEHSVLGTRWVYDGAGDPAFLAMLCAMTLTGVGQAVEIQVVDGRTRVRAPTVRLVADGGAGGAGGLVEVDGFGPPRQADGDTLVTSPTLELRPCRVPAVAAAGPPGRTLLATWPGRSEPAPLAHLSEVRS